MERYSFAAAITTAKRQRKGL